MAAITSASGLLAMLKEPQENVKTHALWSLNAVMEQFWSEIAAEIRTIEEMYEDASFKQRTVAAMVVSKLFYHLEETDEALKYALCAGKHFDVSNASEYVETLLSKCIDEYIRIRSQGQDAAVDARLESIVERMFTRCYNDGDFKHALGIAIESRRLDHVRESISKSPNVPQLLRYAIHLAQTVVQSREFRHELLRELVSIFQEQRVRDHHSICVCYQHLDDADHIAAVLDQLAQKQTLDAELEALQIAFNMSESENQPFLLRIRNKLLPSDRSAPQQMETDDAKTNTLHKVGSILSGQVSNDLFLQFLYTQSHTDVLLVKEMKERIEHRNSVTHSAAITSHALMYCGTTRDTFIRDNLDWLTKASNWAKFSATASFGVIHKGHHAKSMSLLDPYLPKPESTGSPYLEGGGLFGLGLIHANRGGDKVDYLLEALGMRDNEIVQHGACLGLGLNAMATANEALYTKMRDILYQDSAVAGLASGFSMGLVMLSSGAPSCIEEMLMYAQETQHEKSILGLAIGISMIMLGKEELADGTANTMLADKDFLLRYGGCYTLATAYVGTSNNTAIKKLLHVAVSDVSDDVRRAAVLSLGFVMCDSPERVPKVVALFAESYNSHVRYAAAMAVGIACAGTASQAAIALLKPMLKDRVDHVRQGAMLAMAMVLIQCNATQEPYVEEFRTTLRNTIEGKVVDTMTRFGAVLSSGILDAGGRNVTIALRVNGQLRMGAVVGMTVFCHYWYWYPFLHFLSLSFSPAALIGLNANLQMPKHFEVESRSKPSLFAYPPYTEVEKKEKPKQQFTAELSISAKAKSRALKRKKDKGEDVDMTPIEEPSQQEVESKPEPKEEEPNETVLVNPARVTPVQRQYIALKQDQRYVPVSSKLSGIVVLRDTKPNEPEVLIVEEQLEALGVGEEHEPDAPEPFEFTRD